MYIHPKWAKSSSDRSRVFIGSQADREVLRQVAAATQFRFDLIIDDGSHMSDDQVATLSFLWQFLDPSHGIYAIEDLHAHVKFPEHLRKSGLQVSANERHVRAMRATLPGDRAARTARPV